MIPEVGMGDGGRGYARHRVAWTPETVERFWEVEVTHEQNSFARRYGHRIVPVIRRFVPAGSHLLDVGGGPGILAAQLLDAGYPVTVVEGTQAGRGRTLDRNRGRAGLRGVAALDQIEESGPFDAAVGVELLEHLQDNEIADLLGLLRRVLPVGGRCVFTMPNEENLADKTVGCPNCGAQFHRWQHVRSADAPWLGDVLGEVGFEPLRIFTTNWARPVPSRFRGRGSLGNGPHLVGVAERVG